MIVTRSLVAKTTISRCFRSGGIIGTKNGSKLVAYWGLPNLQVINRDAHVAKCAAEARSRATRNFSSEIR